MSQIEWVQQGCQEVRRFLPDFHGDDIQKLVEGLYRSWPLLEPEEAVRCLFAPLQPTSGAAQLL
jgi:hypothetical protein